MSKTETVRLLKLIKSTVYLGNRKFFDALDYAIYILSQPERKTGKWIEDGYYNLPCVCSYCGEEGKHEWSYCPNCGADMRVKNELEEEKDNDH